MNKRIVGIFRPVGIFIFIVLLLAGCEPRSGTKLNPTIRPTNTIEAEETVSTAIQIQSALETSTPGAEQSLEFKTRPYQHRSNLFSLEVPESWTITENQYSASLADTQEDIVGYIEVINTGYVLDDVSLENLIKTREMNRALQFEEFVEVSRQTITDSESKLLTSQFSDQGEYKTVISFYERQGMALLIIDLLVDKDLGKPYQDLLNILFDSVEINPDAVSTLAIYSIDQVNMYSNEYFSFLVPAYWRVVQSRGENSRVDTITSPDEQAVIQTIVYDDGQRLSRNVAGDLVLALLRENYTKNITIVSDEMLKDGREKLTWQSNADNYQGNTTFETRSTSLFIITTMWTNDPEQYYRTLLQEVIDSYVAGISGRP